LHLGIANKTLEVADARLCDIYLDRFKPKLVCRVHWLTVGVFLQIQEQQQQGLSLRPELHDVIQPLEEMAMMDKP
jgi:hypothetical protein